MFGRRLVLTGCRIGTSKQCEDEKASYPSVSSLSLYDPFFDQRRGPRQTGPLNLTPRVKHIHCCSCIYSATGYYDDLIQNTNLVSSLLSLSLSPSYRPRVFCSRRFSHSAWKSIRRPSCSRRNKKSS